MTMPFYKFEAPFILPTLEGQAVEFKKNVSIFHYIAQQLKLTSHRIALIDGENFVTYNELFEKAFSVSKVLDFDRNTCIAVSGPASEKLIVVILAILLRGAGFVFIDKVCPKNRIKKTLESANIGLFIQDDIFYDGSGVTSISFPKLFLEAGNQFDAFDFSSLPIHEDGPAYAIFTSGSTGEPKGILIPHSAVNNHMLWMKNQFSLDENDRFLLRTPLTFDPCIWEMLLPFFVGGTLVILPPSKISNHLNVIEQVKKHSVSVLQLVPVILHRFLSQGSIPESLRYIFSGGESLQKNTKKLFFENLNTSCKLINLYGPAEATIDSTFYEVRNEEKSIFGNYIGNPISNAALYVLDDLKNPCAPGKIGELYIAGDGLAIGYLQEEMNKNAFVEIESISGRLYKTGDLVKYIEGLGLEYVGRKDSQIKLNGVRIETDALKAKVLSFDGVYDCILDLEFSEVYQNKMLTCYIIPTKDHKIDGKLIDGKLRKSFPEYMLPHRYRIVDGNCLSAHGKIDIKSLKKLHALDRASFPAFPFLSKTEQILITLWLKILCLGSIDCEMNFFDAGGDSISGTILIDEINKNFRTRMSFTDLVSHPSIKEQAKHIEKWTEKKTVSVKRETLIKLNANAQNRIFLIHPIGGTVYWFLQLARSTNEKVQIFAIQDPGILSGQTLFDDLYQMSSHYAAIILDSLEEEKECMIGGASFGSTVAVEVARILDAQGVMVESIIALDGWAVYPDSLKDEKYFRDSMLRQQSEWIGQIGKLGYNPSMFERIFKIQIQRLEMLFSYQMSPFDFHLDLFKAKEIMPLFEEIEDKNNHWHRYTNDLKVFNVPGSHETMFSKTKVSAWYQKFLNTFPMLCNKKLETSLEF